MGWFKVILKFFLDILEWFKVILELFVVILEGFGSFYGSFGVILVWIGFILGSWDGVELKLSATGYYKVGIQDGGTIDGGIELV